MRFDELIDRAEECESRSEIRDLLRPHRGEEGLCHAYFGRLLEVYAADPGRASRLAERWSAFRDYGDDPALAYRAKGAADRLAGRWLASARAFERAGELAGDEVDRLTYSVGAIDGLAKAARIEEAVALGGKLADGLDRFGERALAARARLNTANALLHAERGEEARQLYSEAIPAFRAAEMTQEEAMARLGLSTTHLYGGDPAISAREAESSLELARKLDLSFLAALCEMNLAHALLVRGQADEAFAVLRTLRPQLEGSLADLARLDESIGDACLHLNLLDEAAEAYRAALNVEEGLPAVDRAHVLLGLGETLSGSDEKAADQYFALAARGYRRLGNPHWRSAALSGRVRLGASLRVADEAVSQAEGSPYHSVIALLARAEARTKRGIDAEDDLNQAEGFVKKFGFVRFEWRIHSIRALTANSPLPHYRKMLAAILRDRLSATSVAARAGFLRDKSEALGRYLALLLSNPTARNISEVRETIRRTRAATLLDEILSSGRLQVSDQQIERLEQLRQQVAEDLKSDVVPDARGRGVMPHPAQRDWTEATHVLGALDSILPPTDAEGTVVMAETQGELWALRNRQALRLPMSANRLRETLRWFAFEIQAPTADREVSATDANELLEELRAGLLNPWYQPGERVRISPDGLLWHVPWDALLQSDTAATLLFHPSLQGGQTVGTIERIALWIDTPADLPNAVAEERAVLERFPNAKIFRTRREVLASLDAEWDLVHVVGHARHNPGNPMFSALEFPDGPFYASEVARSGLRTRLACLSACETGTLSLAARHEPDGLVRAFLARGAEAVLASLWPLDDEGASIFFRDLYNYLRPCSDLAEIVGKARQTVREWRDHPYFWASLSLFGGYRP